MKETRRKFLSGIAVAGIVSTAGCNSTTESESQTTEAEPKFETETEFNSTIVTENKPISLTVYADNLRHAEDVFSATVSINGSEIATEETLVRPREGTRLIFTITADDVPTEEGKYPVSVNGSVVNEIGVPLSGDWTTYQLDNQNTSYAPEISEPAGNVDVSWKKRVIGTMHFGGPIIDGNTVFLVTGGNLHAFNAATGEKQWQKDLPGDASATPATGPDNIYVSTDISTVAYDKTSGQEQWEKPLSTEDGARPKVADGVVYVHGSSRLYALSTADGSVNWYRGRVETYYPKTIAYANESVYYIDQSGDLFSVRSKDGKGEWVQTFENGIQPGSPPTLYDGSLYVTDGLKRSFRVDAESGDILWEGQMIGEQYYPNYHSPAVDDNHIYEYSRSMLIARNRQTSANEWIYEFGNSGDEMLCGPPVATGESVYVGTYSGKIMALSPKNGVIQWQKELDGQKDFTLAPSLANGYLFVCGTEEGKTTLYALQ